MSHTVDVNMIICNKQMSKNEVLFVSVKIFWVSKPIILEYIGCNFMLEVIDIINYFLTK